VDGYGRDLDGGLAVEVDNFLGLMLDPVAGNMVRTNFLARTAAPRRAAAALAVTAQPVRRARFAGTGVAPEWLSRRLDLVTEPTAADIVLAFDPGPPVTLSIGAAGDAVLRPLGAPQRATAAEVSAVPGSPAAAAALGLAERLRLLPVVTTAVEGVAASLLEALRAVAARHAPDAASRGRLARALDLGAFFAAAGLSVDEAAGFSAADRTAGLALLDDCAAVAASSLAAGAVADAVDLDVLAVHGLGFPAWTGGPLAYRDGRARGEITSPPAAAAAT